MKGKALVGFGMIEKIFGKSMESSLRSEPAGLIFPRKKIVRKSFFENDMGNKANKQVGDDIDRQKSSVRLEKVSMIERGIQ